MLSLFGVPFSLGVDWAWEGLVEVRFRRGLRGFFGVAGWPSADDSGWAGSSP